MLEPLNDNFEGKYTEYIKIVPLLNLYVRDCGTEFMNELKLLNMLRYFKIYEGNNLDDIGDFGEYFKSKHKKFLEIDIQRQVMFGNAKTKTGNYITNPDYLMATYSRLKRSMLNKTQYIILKDAILMISPDDTKLFVNLILRKYQIAQIKEIINKIQNGK